MNYSNQIDENDPHHQDRNGNNGEDNNDDGHRTTKKYTRFRKSAIAAHEQG